MSEAVLHYIYDPMCGWCYAAEPLVEAARQTGIEIILAGGNLFPVPSVVEPAKRQAIRLADSRIEQLTGQPFGDSYLNGLLNDPTSTWWSRPTIAAVLAAKQIDPRSGFRMLKAIQKAHYVDGRRVSEAETLADIAQELDFDRQTFSDTLTAAPVDEHIQATRALMARHDLHGFPSFLLEHRGTFHRVPHEQVYGKPASFVAMLRGTM